MHLIAAKREDSWAQRTFARTAMELSRPREPKVYCHVAMIANFLKRRFARPTTALCAVAPGILLSKLASSKWPRHPRICV